MALFYRIAGVIVRRPTTATAPNTKYFLSQATANALPVSTDLEESTQISLVKSTHARPLLHYSPPPKQAWLVSLKTGNKLGIIDLNEDVFGAPPRLDILHRVVVWQRAKIRAGTAKTKDRGEVRGGGRKPMPQKGTGRARQGSIRAPHMHKGGIVHGPRGPRSYYYTLPQKVVTAGLRTALSVKYMQGDVIIVDCLEVDSLKTKNFLSLSKIHDFNSALLVDGGDVSLNLCRATRNLQKVNVLPSRGLNVYSILLHDKLVLSLGAVRMLEERLLRYITPVQMLCI